VEDFGANSAANDTEILGAISILPASFTVLIDVIIATAALPLNIGEKIICAANQSLHHQ